jgi:hypothetical protein
VSFDVKRDKSQHILTQPEAGKATVYFIQDNGIWGEDQQYNTLKIGLDGAWVGAYKNNSYFAIFVEPGEHHICANVQSNFSEGQVLAFAHFTAEPGRVYYFRTRFLNGIIHLPRQIPGYPPPPYLELDPADSDEAKYLIASYPLSVSTPKQ